MSGCLGLPGCLDPYPGPQASVDLAMAVSPCSHRCLGIALRTSAESLAMRWSRSHGRLRFLNFFDLAPIAAHAGLMVSEHSEVAPDRDLTQAYLNTRKYPNSRAYPDMVRSFPDRPCQILLGISRRARMFGYAGACECLSRAPRLHPSMWECPGVRI